MERYLGQSRPELPVTRDQQTGDAAPVQGSEVSEATRALEADGIEVAPVVLHNRKAFYSHWQLGQTAQELDPDGKAAGEIRDLTLWLCERLGMTRAADKARKTA